MTRLDSPATCVDYSPDGDSLIVGLGIRTREIGAALSTSSDSSTTSNAGNGDEGVGQQGGSKRGKLVSGDGSKKGSIGAKTGGFVVLKESDFILIFEARDSKKVLVPTHMNAILKAPR